ncbi:ATP-binding cassette domain-containing protein [Actinoplanes couchii]|uniref:ABC transporter ATP-binding protein n=1 Tax=Actinoplanes couchii TaxID=403638 RepID=A0ABQ3XDA9_9ACTN|nr:ABC transporter ATP-binding protein [Actinoplanes couchii]MDR6321274.1 ABC-type multidrug transport system ATPase subunit [Actinoplanes couchii]GID56385.1 ABC transporter ATP-binding protein [Actinoplanes couchii]
MLRLTDVSKRYGSGAWVLDRVDMEIPPGQSVGILGSNGSGKSTLLRILAGISRPTRGRISGMPRLIGYVPDRFPAADAMNPIAYLVHIGRIRGLGGDEARRRGLLLLERLRLAGGIRTPIRALSKGNAQKVALAQALMTPPELLILDEPWSGLDAGAHQVLGEIIAETVRAGGSVVFTDHRESVTGAHATMAYRVDQGRVLRHQPGTRAPMAHVMLTDPGAEFRSPSRIDWHEVDGVAGVGGDGGQIQLRVHPAACDDLLMIALRGGWSVAEVRRDHAATPARDGERWSR